MASRTSDENMTEHSGRRPCPNESSILERISREKWRDLVMVVKTLRGYLKPDEEDH